MSKQRKLPARFPVGTRYIIEGEPGTAGNSGPVAVCADAEWRALRPDDAAEGRAPGSADRRGRTRVERTGPPSRLRHSEAP